MVRMVSVRKSRVRLKYLGVGGWSTWERVVGVLGRVGFEHLGEGVRAPGRVGVPGRGVSEYTGNHGKAAHKRSPKYHRVRVTFDLSANVMVRKRGPTELK